MDGKTEAKYRQKCIDIIKKLQDNSKRLTADLKKIDEIFLNYKTYRESIHKNMKCKDTQTKTEPMMDNHKIAAAFFCSFLKARPLKYNDSDSKVPPNGLELRANEQGAFLFGLQAVQDFWADKAVESIPIPDQEIYKKLIRLPKTDEDHYIHWFNKLVVDGMEKYIDFKDNKYEEKMIFFIAHIYFLLDKYSYQYHKAKLYESRSEFLAREVVKQGKKKTS